MNDNDYDEDGNNIVPCPICMSSNCPSKEDGKCTEEDDFVKSLTMTTKEKLQAEFEEEVKWFADLEVRDGAKMVEATDAFAFFASRFPEMVMEYVGGSKEALQKKRWIEHGRQCAIRTRPCGAVEHPDRLADICSARSYDFETISAFNEEIKHRLVEDGWVKE